MLRILIILAALSCIGTYYNTLPKEEKQKNKKQEVSFKETYGCFVYVVLVLVVVGISICFFGKLYGLI